MREISGLSRAEFEADILPAGKPVVMRGLVADWPEIGRSAPEVFESLKPYDSGAIQGTLIGGEGVKGQFNYAPNLRGQNYGQTPETLSAGLDRILSGSDKDGAYLQSIPLDVHMPNFVIDHAMPLLAERVSPRAWIGGPTTVQTHFDQSHNIACVVLGERVVTVFPPNQLPGLYPGPLETAPGGAIVSLTNLDDPDFDAHPKFEAALAKKQQVTLRAGDAIYIPYGWWHHVRATAPLNMLVNYWFVPNAPRLETPYAAMAIAMLCFDRLDDNAREVWSGLFDHFVFRKNGDPMGHVDDNVRGFLGGVPVGREAGAIHEVLSVLGPMVGLSPPPRK
jgi:hypothetical protein